MIRPTMHATIDRRLLVNYRVDPQLAARVLPEPFRPRLVGGVAIGGICLIRLTDLRPPWAPPMFALTTENAAHRFAVEFDADGHGVFIPRRDTSSRLTVLLGGRAFPGLHHRADIVAREDHRRFAIALRSRDGSTRVAITASEAATLPPTSMFETLEQATRFFRDDPLGFSTTARPGSYDCMELDAPEVSLTPLTVQSVESSMFDDRSIFPTGSVQFDSAFLMRHVNAMWRPHAPLTAT